MRSEKIGLLVYLLNKLGQIQDAQNERFDQARLDQYTATRDEMANEIVAHITVADLTADETPSEAAAALLIFAMSEIEFRSDEMTDPARHALNLVLDYLGSAGVDIDGLGADRLIMSRMERAQSC